MYRKNILILVGAITLLVLAWALWWQSKTEPAPTGQETVEQPSRPSATQNPEPGTPSTDPELYGYIQDAGFVAFAYNVIEKKCPFYSPNGAVYRECLTTWMEDLLSKLPPREQDAIEATCTTFAESYTDASSHAGGELFAKCTIYHASDYR